MLYVHVLRMQVMRQSTYFQRYYSIANFLFHHDKVVAKSDPIYEKIMMEMFQITSARCRTYFVLYVSF
jgi:LPS sulfotransferase NodH